MKKTTLEVDWQIYNDNKKCVQVSKLIPFLKYEHCSSFDLVRSE